jgi:hypothetical protein
MSVAEIGTEKVQTYPRPITTVHQIETTTFCDLRCVYCPSRKLETVRGQAKQDMSLDTYRQALEWAKFYDKQGTQGELSLTGIGETLLHPELFELMRLAREALPNTFINFSTNGLKLTDEICVMLAAYDISLFVSLHRPEKAGLAIQLAKKHGIFVSANGGASVSAFDWAGQVDWFVSAPEGPCDWLREGWCNVLVDGRITVCCLDAAAQGVVGHVDQTELMGELKVKPFSLCTTCHLHP